VAAPSAVVFGQARVGGDVGLFFGELMRGLFSAPGSFLVGLTGVGLIFIGRSSFSFIEWCERVLGFYSTALSGLQRMAFGARDIWRRASFERAEQGREAKKPSIHRPDPDAVILHHLEQDTPWIPGEATGAPPLEVAESLRRAFSPRPDLEDEGPPSFAEVEFLGVDPSPTLSETPPGADGLWQGLTEVESSAAAGEYEASEIESLDEDHASEDEGEAFELAAILTDDRDEVSGDEPRIVDTSTAQVTRAARPEKSKIGQGGYVLPPTDLLHPPDEDERPIDRDV